MWIIGKNKVLSQHPGELYKSQVMKIKQLALIALAFRAVALTDDATVANSVVGENLLLIEAWIQIPSSW